MNEKPQYLLSKKDRCNFIITQEWLNISTHLRYFGNAEEVAASEMLCGLVVDATAKGYRDYLNNNKSTDPVESFISLLTSLGIQLDKSWHIYREII